jgi:integrase/recombinase XerD
VATLYRRNNSKLWWIRFQWRGTEVRKSARTTSKQEALRFLARTLEECRKLDREGRTRQTFDEVAYRFAQEHLPTLKPRSAERYRVSLRALAPTFKGLCLDEITKTRLASFISQRRKTGLAGATVRRDIACLSSMFELAKSWDWITTNPVRDLDLRSVRAAPPRTRYLSKKEEERLIAAATGHLKPMIIFAIETGMRFEEQFSLEHSQINHDRREITLTKTKTNNPRVIPLTDRSAQILAQLPRHPWASLVFHKEDGTRYHTLKRSFASAARRAGIQNLRWHDLRRTCGCRLIQEYGLDLYKVSRWLGHKTVAVTERAYAFLRIDDLHAAIRLGTKPGTAVAPTGFAQQQPM